MLLKIMSYLAFSKVCEEDEVEWKKNVQTHKIMYSLINRKAYDLMLHLYHFKGEKY